MAGSMAPLVVLLLLVVQGCCYCMGAYVHAAQQVWHSSRHQQHGHQQDTARVAMQAMVSDAESYTGSNPKVYVARGMDRFRRGRVQDSVDDFDHAIGLNAALAPCLWQRGLSLYYVNRFEEAAAQFRLDVSVNPNDTEEAVWAMACEANTLGLAQARKRLLRVGNDPRRYMRVAYALFGGAATEEDLALVGQSDEQSRFYAHLYLGLYTECGGEVGKAMHYIGAAASSPYCTSGDYMCSLAQVHLKVRGW